MQGQKGIRRERKTYKILNRKLQTLWHAHAKSLIDTAKLLTECAVMYTKMNATRYTNNIDDDREFELEAE
jgi:hypothetical protein